MRDPATKKIWIDLDNSPHVPFFKPIIRELKQAGFQVNLTARDCFQVCELADLHGLEYEKVGRHFGKSKILKIYGTLVRCFQLLQKCRRDKPALAVSHGSRAQMIAAKILRIPSVVLDDYEHSIGLVIIKANWLIMPELIVAKSENSLNGNVLSYPGIKEDVYVPDFSPDPSIKGKLGIDSNKLVATIRPPATEAHYHNNESEEIFNSIIDYFSENRDVQIVILPRTGSQEDFIKAKWKDKFHSGDIKIPASVLNGLDLIASSDMVISGGGTMIREAAALNVPAYSFFKGAIGAVDEYLVKKNRLTLIGNKEEITSKIILKHHTFDSVLKDQSNTTLSCITDHIKSISLQNESTDH